MFEILHKRMVESFGMRVYSFEDLEHLDIDSVDSLSFSETPSSNGCSDNILSTEKGSVSPSDTNSIEEYAKRKVIKILRTIKKLEKLHVRRQESRMPMCKFIDFIRDKQYIHVNMGLLSSFIKTCKMVPKTFYLHYFMYFLYYASYYHHARATTDIIDIEMKDYHKKHLICIKHQLKYLQYIISQSRIKEITL